MNADLVPEPKIRPTTLQALALLLEAADCADPDACPWEFAVELSAVLEMGGSRSSLRWLVSQDYAEHVVETTRFQARRRSFVKTPNLAFNARSCFILTESGLAFSRQFTTSSHVPDAPDLNKPLRVELRNARTARPHWDQVMRELRFGRLLVKAYTQPSPNQETILAVFQEESWPARIDNPLSPQKDQGKRRLHDTITRLNRHQRHRLIRFRSDSNGEGIRWTVLS